MCSHGSTHAVCTQASVQGILVCREGAADNHPDQRHTRVFNSSASACEGRSWEQGAGRKDDGADITNAPGLTLIVEHFNAARLIRQMASSRKDETCVCMQRHTHTRTEIKPVEFFLSVVSLARSHDLSKNTKHTCSISCICHLPLTHTRPSSLPGGATLNRNKYG